MANRQTQDLYGLFPASEGIRNAIKALCAIDPDFARVEAAAGEIKLLSIPPTFAGLVRIITGQQLSATVAKTIYQRLVQSVTLDPAAFLSTPEDALRQVGLSRSKITCCRTVAQAIVDGELDLDALATLDDAQILARLTGIKGIGPWTAELFMLFALERLDIFPAGDLAIQRAYSHLKNHASPVAAKALIDLAVSLQPYRSAATHLLWHYYRHLQASKKI